MSRTDVHTPNWVKKLQPEWRDFFIEHHDHTNRDCNFDPKNDNWQTQCLLGERGRGRNIHCGCKMCTGQIARRHDRRAERYLAKRVLRSGNWEDGVPKYSGNLW